MEGLVDEDELERLANIRGRVICCQKGCGIDVLTYRIDLRTGKPGSVICFVFFYRKKRNGLKRLRRVLARLVSNPGVSEFKAQDMNRILQSVRARIKTNRSRAPRDWGW